MTELIITEKPSSAEKVAQALADGKPAKKKYRQVSYFEISHNGKRILVASAIGHLYTLVEAKKNGWSYPVFDIRWKAGHLVSKEMGRTKEFIDAISALAKEAEHFTIACDYDVEGEIIGLNVIRFACRQKDAGRMKFSTLTKDDLIGAYRQKMRHLDWGQAHAGETRHKLDWFYGINLSRALTGAVKAAGSFKLMSAGRVQGPTLKLLVEREREINAFTAEPYWEITATNIKNKIEFESLYQRKIEIEKIKENLKLFFDRLNEEPVERHEKIKNKLAGVEALKQAKIIIENKSDILKCFSVETIEYIKKIILHLERNIDQNKLWDKKETEQIFRKIKDEKKALIKKIAKSVREHSPPYPFDLTTLQTESYAKFGITPKETLSLAQNLYLAGVTSYPRTSSQQLDPKLGFTKILQSLSRQPEYAALSRELLKLPRLQPNNGRKTDPAHPAIYPTGQFPKSLKPKESKVYDLIVRRFMATFAEPAIREIMDVELEVKKEIFLAKGARTIKENWHIFYKPYLKVEETLLPEMKEGEMVHIKEIRKADKKTQPPKRFTQASIIRELERRNLGTKATRADTLERLFQRGYIEGVQMHVTKLGMETISILEKHAPMIINEKLTAHFEEDMEKIREGREKEENVLEEAKRYLEKLLADFKKKEKDIGRDIIQSLQETREEQNYIGACPVCKAGKLRITRGKFGRFIACNTYPKCTATFKLPGGMVKGTEKACEHCHYPLVLVIRKGKRPQEVCINTECKGKTSAEEKHQIKKFEQGKLEKQCPKCGKPMVVRKSMYGSFFGCSGYPKCRHTEKLEMEKTK